MNRRVLHLSAVIGAIGVSTLAVAPAFAATTVSQATAQSLNVAIAGNNAVSQTVTATNYGTDPATKTNDSTVPNIADLVPGNSLLTAGVAPQDAGANADGTSYACAGLAGTASTGVVTTNKNKCDVDGAPLNLNLASLDLGNVVISDTSALGSALNGIPGIGAILTTLGQTAGGLSTQIATALAATPLGEISIGTSLSVVEATCTANPDAAQGTTHIADVGGAAALTITLPGGATVPLVNLPVNPPPNTKVLSDLGTVTDTVIAALRTQLASTVLGPIDSALDPLLDPVLTAVQTQVVDALIAQIKDPLLVPLEQNVADITLNKQVVSDGGKKIQITAIDAQVLPAAAAAAGASLISGEIGKVSCGPNARVVAETPPPTTPSCSPPDPKCTPPETPEVPTVVDSGLAGNGTTRTVLAATAALMLLAGSAGLIGYRRMLSK